MGIQAKQKIGSLWTFYKGFEDWLDLKCNLNEMVEVHVSRDRFIHTHFAPTCCLFTLDYNSQRVKETLIRILSLKTGFFGVSITFLTFYAFWNGWNNFFCTCRSLSKWHICSFHSQDTSLPFIKDCLGLHVYNDGVCEGSRNKKYCDLLAAANAGNTENIQDRSISSVHWEFFIAWSFLFTSGICKFSRPFSCTCTHM